MQDINITLGTSGHIDHGKTVLIKALTGCNTDRLKAEQQRGMSIDLGFAACNIADKQVGIVDVPGHENFIKTMVAGTTGIDAIIFVIAADDGIMPQTIEHLDILNLLGVKKGILALTKTDTVNSKQLNAVTAEIKNYLAGTFLKNSPLVPVSAITGQGLENLYTALKELVNSIEPKSTSGVFRMPVERSFSLKGYGTVVTGIPTSGAVESGTELVLLPQDRKAEVRAIQVYKRTSNRAVCGQCAAINIPKLDYKNINRGDVLGVPGYFEPAQWYLCKLKYLNTNTQPLKHSSEIKFHTGTAAVPAKLFLLEGNTVQPGSESLVQIRVNQPVIAAPRDKFIIRSLSPTRTIGGGFIVEPLTKKLKRSRPDVFENAKQLAAAVTNNLDFAEYVTKHQPEKAVDSDIVSARCKILPETAEKLLEVLTRRNRVISLNSKQYIHVETYQQIKNRIFQIIEQYHTRHPASPGIEPEELFKQFSISRDILKDTVKLILAEGKLVRRKGCFGLADHIETFSEQDRPAARRIERLFRQELFSPPKPEMLEEKLDIDNEQIEEIVNALLEQKRLIKVDKKLIFHRQAVEQAENILTDYIRENGRLESVKFKYLLNTTRKFAIPLLDYFDWKGVTKRINNTRYLQS